jgi:hypothetical protein
MEWWVAWHHRVPQFVPIVIRQGRDGAVGRGISCSLYRMGYSGIAITSLSIMGLD